MTDTTDPRSPGQRVAYVNPDGTTYLGTTRRPQGDSPIVAFDKMPNFPFAVPADLLRVLTRQQEDEIVRALNAETFAALRKQLDAAEARCNSALDRAAGWVARIATVSVQHTSFESSPSGHVERWRIEIEVPEVFGHVGVRHA